jgi:hypothetical protein
MPDQDTLLMIAAIGASALIFGALAAGAVLVVRDTIRGRGMWGINFRMPTECPECAEPLAAVRVPTSFRQAMVGGWTCGYCGCEIDKWGKVISPPTRPVEFDEEPAEETSPPPRRRRAPDDRFRQKDQS